MKKGITLALSLVFAAVLMSYKISTNTNDNQSIVAKLVGKKWYLSEVSVNPNIDFNRDGTPDSRVESMLADCEKDDFLIFQKTGHLVYDKAELKCPEQVEPFSRIRTWSYKATDNIIQLRASLFDKFQEDWKILELNDSSFTVMVEKEMAGEPFKIKMKLVAR